MISKHQELDSKHDILGGKRLELLIGHARASDTTSLVVETARQNLVIGLI